MSPLRKLLSIEMYRIVFTYIVLILFICLLGFVVVLRGSIVCSIPVIKSIKMKKVDGQSKIDKDCIVEAPVLSRKGVSNNWKKFRGSIKLPVLACEPSKNQKYIPAKRKSSKILAIDCEMVADSSGSNMLARVSVVDFSLNCIYDKYVKPTSEVMDYRTRFSGIRPENLKDAEPFETVKEEVRKLLRNKIIVGHSIRNDLNVLHFGHHVKLIRDTSLYKPFREVSDGKTPSLRKLVKALLGESIQEGEHSSIQDATAAMKLYKKYRHEWEKSLICPAPVQC